MPAPKNPRSKERPAIGRIDLQRMRGELDHYVRLPPGLPDDLLVERSAKIRPILSDPRLAGHYGYVDPKKVEKMKHGDLQRHAVILQAWVERWLR
jgi:hypothetical protein